mgnify:CR=1 FL=1
MGLSPALLKKLKEAKATAGGNNITDGSYIFEVAELILDAKRKGTMFIPRLLVVESEKILVDVEPNQVGSTCSNALNLDTNVSAPGNAKAFFMGLLNMTESEADEVVEKRKVDGEEVEFKRWMVKMDEYTRPSQLARGMLVGDETYRKTIQTGPNAGKPFTAHNWVYIAQTSAEVAARRKAQDGTAASAAAK